jgi:molecular chaperone DnaK (HSP70)
LIGNWSSSYFEVALGTVDDQSVSISEKNPKSSLGMSQIKRRITRVLANKLEGEYAYLETTATEEELEKMEKMLETESERIFYDLLSNDEATIILDNSILGIKKTIQLTRRNVGEICGSIFTQPKDIIKIFSKEHPDISGACFLGQPFKEQKVAKQLTEEILPREEIYTPDNLNNAVSDVANKAKEVSNTLTYAFSTDKKCDESVFLF